MKSSGSIVFSENGETANHHAVPVSNGTMASKSFSSGKDLTKSSGAFDKIESTVTNEGSIADSPLTTSPKRTSINKNVTLEDVLVTSVTSETTQYSEESEMKVTGTDDEFGSTASSRADLATGMATEGAEVIGVHRLHEESVDTTSLGNGGYAKSKARKPSMIKKMMTNRNSKAAAAAERAKKILDQKVTSIDMAALCGIVDIVSYRLNSHMNIESSWVSFGIEGLTIPLITPTMLNEQPLKYMDSQLMTVN